MVHHLSPFFVLLAALCVASPVVHAQLPRKVVVDSFQGRVGSTQLRNRVIARLHDSREVRLVDHAADADFVVHGTGEIWLKGYVSVNPHPVATVHQPIYGGYLSLEVESRSGEVIWSYLVTPGRMHLRGMDDEMADHIVRLMLAALRQSGANADQPLAASQGQISLSGAGSTFSAPLYQEWIQSFESRHPGIHTTYQAVGSESGIRLLEDGRIDFAASDVPLTDAQIAAAPSKFDQYATVLGGVVPAYNVPSVGRDLHFTPEALAAIYLGRITRWNDPQLRSINRSVSLPDLPIVVLHRSDGSGTSFAWTEFLSRTSADWKSAVGSGMRVQWPAGEGIAGNEGVAARIASTPGAIGYVELTYAIWHELSFGLVRNASGRFQQANLATLSEAAASASASGDLRASLVNAPGKDAYPIATFTWILVPASNAAGKKSVALEDLLRWMLTSGQKECSGLGYVPLPKNLAEKELGLIRSTSPSTATPAN